MRQINLSFNDEDKNAVKGYNEGKLFNDISLLAEVAFNNNKNNTILTILNKALELEELKININGIELSAKEILLKVNKGTDGVEGKKLSEVITNVKADFRKNFYLLDSKVQRALLIFLDDLRQRYGCSFGNVANISTYINNNGNNALCFYINISGKRGNIDIASYLKNLSYNGFKYRSIENRNNKDTIWLSKKDQFIRNFKYNKHVSERFFIKALSLLDMPTDLDAIELTVQNILNLVGKI